MNASHPDDKGFAAVTEQLMQTLGADTVAALLRVSVDQASRWATSEDTPDTAGREALTQLETLAVHLSRAFTPEQVPLWLYGQDSYLHARPIDVYRIDGAAPVIEAIEAFEQGAFS